MQPGCGSFEPQTDQSSKGIAQATTAAATIRSINGATSEKAKHDDSDGPTKERQEVQLQDEIKVAKKMLSNSELLLFAKGMETKFFYSERSALLKEGHTKLSGALANLESFQKKKKWKPSTSARRCL